MGVNPKIKKFLGILQNSLYNQTFDGLGLSTLETANKMRTNTSLSNIEKIHLRWSCWPGKKGPATLLKKKLWHRYFPVNFEKFLRTSYFTEKLQWLLLPGIKELY